MKKNKILLIGSKGLFGSSFVSNYNNKYEIIQIDRDNYKQKLASIKNDQEIYFECVVFSAQSKDYRLDYISDDLFGVNIKLLHNTINSVVDKTNQINITKQEYRKA